MSMNKPSIFRSKWAFGLLTLPVIFSFFALTFGDFGFKAGVTGSCILILGLQALFTRTPLKSIGLILIAFMLSIGGDWFLSHRQGEIARFIYGIALFFLAHVGFLLYALRQGKVHLRTLAVVLPVYLVFYFGWLLPVIDSFSLNTAVLLYLVISCVSLSAATGIVRLPRSAKFFFIAGIGMIIFSDTLIALREFLSWDNCAFLILPTYYLSHLFITAALVSAMLDGNHAAECIDIHKT